MTRSKSNNCPFCKSDSEAVFAESKNFLALYNLAPILPGHSLVVPKRHVESLMALSRPVLGEFMVFSRDVAQLLGRAFQSSAFNWTIQEQEEAGQTVAHLHLHLIPRKPKDLPEPGDWYPLLQKKQAQLIDSAQRPRLEPEQMRAIVSHLKSFVPKSQTAFR